MIRNYDYEALSRLRFADLAELLKSAEKREKIKILRDEYNSIYPLMITQFINYMTFDEYYSMCTRSDIDTRPAEDVIKDIHLAEVKFKKGGN